MTFSSTKRLQEELSDTEFNDQVIKRQAIHGETLESSSDDEMSFVEEEEIQMPEEHFNNAKWQNTISKVVGSVVSIHFAQVAPFDCDPALVSEATGFVVDSELGIILTNRHVVGAGPFVGYAVFDNHEECDVLPIYRDPVHDFGFLKFDPKKIKYMNIQALELKPSLAKVGSEIRVIGNDAGEKLSILAGFISRIDRNAPDYGELTYNDFNTEYIQAAASASGGSSGSPVVNIDGHAVALQAGGSTEASTDFFLPVNRILRALNCIREDKPVTRGTIQTQWILRPYDECRRLGLTSDRELEARNQFPERIGLLVAETVLREGPSDTKIKEGDTLISINGELIASFMQVDDIFDKSVGENVELLIQRGGKDITVECEVGDLHAITPSSYLEVCGATFNELSYQMARFYAIPVRGVFLSSATGSFNFDSKEKVGWIVDAIDNQETPNLETFIEVMKTVPDKKRVTVRYHHLTDQHSPNVSSIYIDRHWCSEFRIYQRNDKTGIWDYKNVAEPLKPLPEVPHEAKFIDLSIENKQLAKLSRSLVTVTTISPIPLDSMSAESRKTSGLVIDAQQGYVIVSRRAVLHDCLDVFVTIADSVIVPAEVIFLHPTQNYAVVKYDPSLVKAPVETPRLSFERMKRGDRAHFIGYTHNNRLVSSDTKVTDISSLSIPSNLIPRYRATNLEAIGIDCNVSSRCNSGIIADDDGTVRALWLPFLGEIHDGKEKVYLLGLDMTDLKAVIDLLQIGKRPRINIVDAGFGSISIAQARIRGIPEEWIARMERESENRLQFMQVTRVSFSKEEEKLLPGDVILCVEGKLVKEMRDLDGIVTSGDGPNEEQILNFKVVRNGKIVDISVKTVEVNETSHFAVFAGCILQAPHHAVLQAMSSIPSSVYCTFRGQSSPATQYGIAATNFITHINEIETPDLDTFLEVVKNIPDNTYCKIRLVTFDNVPFAISLKTNYHYFPTAQLKKDSATGKWIEDELNKTEEKTD
ncbi:LANO_0E12706g1_1 [Lachancea nothofagi CBS 11611]|uniref:Pro-apoptotic serine protease NMA111 n=1 Tax=Lachancea nothofagi CBS 11611 TaxID=1266666 RepID=A0A1G4JYD8_9SACH|nr:LANO_0E12706g1_1 [Lachancea nothofagi CBS 11611]